MAAATSDLEVRVKGKDELSPTLAQLESRVIRWVGAIGASLAAIKIAAAPITAAAEFERELANVAKTTNFAKSEINQLSAALLDMSTRIDISSVDLAKIAAAAGQQGLGKFGVQGVLQFTDSVSRMSSVLDVTAEEAAENIGKVVNIFKIPLSEIERAVSTFNQVSNNSTAQGKELLDVVRRIGDAAGSLDLQQATALAATGLDFGQSPEVVGTAFANIFANLRAKAGEFGKIMNMSATDWIKIVETDGLGALKQVLEAFRGLDAQSQQVAITKLFGGGRISTLVNKLVQDTQNAVLTRNFDQAIKGKQGTSAIKEQETVLNTLVAQSQAALNSLYKLGVEVTAGALQPLREYVVELNKALQSPALKSFLTAAVGAIMDMVGGVVTAIKFVADLNVNWENFVRVAQVFLGLKLAQFFGGALSNSTAKFSASLKTLRYGAEEAATATKTLGVASAGAAAQQQAADAAFKGSIASRLFGYEELSKKMAAYKAAKAAEVIAEKEAAAAAIAAQAARNAQAVVVGRATAAGSQTQAAAQAAQTQRAALSAAQAAAQAAQDTVMNARNARVQQAEAASTLKLLDIEQDYQNKKAAIKATGTRVGMAALEREKAALIAAEEASYQRSLTGINSYYAKRATAAAAGSAALINAEKAALMSRLSALDGAVNNQAGKTVNLAASSAQVAAANAALDASTAKLTLAQRGMNAASVAAANFGLAMRTLGTVVAAAGRLIASGFFWVTIIYSIGDALGLFDDLSGKLSKVTDALGFTSQAMRDEAIEREKKKKQLKEEEEALDDLIKKYKDYTNAANGSLTTEGTNAVAGIVAKGKAAEDQSSKLQSIAELEEFQRSIDAQLAKSAESLYGGNDARVDAAKARLAQYAKELSDLQNKMTIPQEALAGIILPSSQFQDSGEAIKRVQEAIKKTEAEIATFGDSTGVLAERVAGLTKSSLEVGKAIANMFTPETLKYAQDNITAYNEIRLQVEEAEKKYKDLAQAARGGGTEQQAAAATAEAALIVLRAQQDSTRASLTAFIDTQISMPGVPDNVKASWEQLKLLIASTATVAQGVISAATQAVGAGAIPTGANANANRRTPTTGGNSYSGKKDKSGESEARKLARARLDFERAQIQAENNLKEEQAKQQLAIQDRFAAQGLVAYADYYKTRQEIQLQANQFDIDDKNREVKAVDEEIKAAKDVSEKMRFQTQKVKLEGEINVLRERRKEIEADNAEEQRKELEIFQNNIRANTNKLLESSLIPDDLNAAFKGNLDELLAEYKKFINQLRAEGKDALADSLTATFKADALDRSLAPIGNAIGSSLDAVGRYQTRLSLAVTNGVLTSNQAQAAYNDAIKAQIRPLQQLLEAQQTLLANNSELAVTAPVKYQAMQDAVDTTRLHLEQLSAEQDKFAKDFNQANTDSLSSILGSLEASKEGIVKALNDFVVSIAKNVQQALGKSLSEMFMQSIGQTGTGGLGGWLQGIIQGKGAESIGGIAGGKGVTLGATPLTAMYVRSADASGLLGKGFGEIKTDALDDKIASILKSENMDVPDVSTKAFDSVSAGLEKTFSGIATDMTSIFGDLSTTITGLFSNLGSALSSASGSGGWLQMLVSLFHNGGEVGTNSGMSRKVNPMIFAGAPRYHEGTMPGLKGDEVAAVLQKGEHVLTERQQADVAARAEGGGGGAGTRIVNVLDPDLARNFMESSAGEKVVINHIRRNASLVSQTIKGG